MVGGKEEGDEERSGGLPRRARLSPAEYLIPARAVPPEFQKRVEEPDYEPATPKDASTVAVVREIGGVAEVLLVRRPSRSRFAADAWVFPGGVVDDEDRAAAAEVGGARTWAERAGFGDAGSAAAHLTAAVREVWEETGLFLAETQAPAAELSRLRDELLAGTPFNELARAGGFRIVPDRFVYLARWTTPEPEPRRYDTRFFLAEVPAEAEVSLRGAELEAARWFAIAEAIRGFEEGDLHMLPPTVHTLRQLSGFGAAAEMLESLGRRSAGDFLPRMSAHPDGILIRLEEPRRP